MTRRLQAALVFVATATLLVLFARGANLARVLDQIVGADVPLLVVALTASTSAYLLRARRWQFLLRPVGSTHFAAAFQATAIGFAATFLLPGRTGEVLRPYLLARRDGLSPMATFATIVVERLLDMIAVLLLFAGVLWVAHPGEAVREASLFRTVQFAGVVAGGLSLLGFALIVLVARNPTGAERAVQRLGPALPATLIEKATRVVRSFTAGFAILRRPADAALALAGALPLWSCTLVSIWCVSKAFHLGIPVSGTFVLLMLLVLGVAVPTPGGIGGVHYAFRLGATALYAARDDRAVGAAIVLHALTFLPVTALGLLFAAQQGLSVSRLRDLATVAAGKDASPSAAPGPGEKLESSVNI